LPIDSIQLYCSQVKGRRLCSEETSVTVSEWTWVTVYVLVDLVEV
jgi:hypothetical protein